MVKWKRIFPLFIISAGLLAYANSFSGVFVFDDHVVITGNPEIGRFSSVSLTSRMVVDQTFKLNFLTGGVRPADYHLTNLLIHILAGLLLFGIVRRTLILPRFMGKYLEDSDLLACICAGLWVVHPLQTQSVTYVCQRFESMMGLFFLLSLYCFIRGYTSLHKRLWYDLSIVSCIIGMGTKEVMVAAPFVVLVYDYVFLSGSINELVRSRWKIHAALFASIGVLACLLACSLAREMNVSTRFVNISPMLYLMNQCEVIAHYLRLAVCPAPLCLDYSWPVSADVLQLLPWILFTGTLFAGSAVAAWQRRPYGFLGLSFFAVLATTSSVIPLADLAFEHRMYISSAFVVILMVLGSYNLAEHFSLRRSVWLAICCILVGISGFLTFQRNKDYHSEEAIWRDVVVKRPDNLRARNDLAVALSEAGKIEEALAEYDRVLASIPRNVLETLRTGRTVVMDTFVTSSFEYQYVRANVNRATLMLAQNGGESKAVEYFINALRVAPFFGNVRERLKAVLRSTGTPEDKLDLEIQKLIADTIR